MILKKFSVEDRPLGSLMLALFIHSKASSDVSLGSLFCWNSKLCRSFNYLAFDLRWSWRRRQSLFIIIPSILSNESVPLAAKQLQNITLLPPYLTGTAFLGFGICHFLEMRQEFFLTWSPLSSLEFLIVLSIGQWKYSGFLPQSIDMQIVGLGNRVELSVNLWAT